MVNIEKTISVLNSLVQINNDRIEGYEQAAKITDDADLIRLFNGMVAKSLKLKRELAYEVDKLGGLPTESTTNTGKIFRKWMDFKALVTGKNRYAILSSCEFGEDVAQESYDDAIKDNSDLPPDLMELLNKQKVLLRDDHNQIKTLLNIAKL